MGNSQGQAAVAAVFTLASLPQAPEKGPSAEIQMYANPYMVSSKVLQIATWSRMTIPNRYVVSTAVLPNR